VLRPPQWQPRPSFPTGRGITGRTGFTKLGIENVGALVTRGVLIDVAGLKGVDILAGGYEITVTDLQQALARQKLSLQPGDAVIIHTGWGKLRGKDNARYMKSCPGVGVAAAAWLARQDPMLVGSDNVPVEVSPNPDPQISAPGHQIFLVINGIHLVETRHAFRAACRDSVKVDVRRVTSGSPRPSEAGPAVRCFRFQVCGVGPPRSPGRGSGLSAATAGVAGVNMVSMTTVDLQPEQVLAAELRHADHRQERGTAMCRAARTSSVRRYVSMAHPTTWRLHASSTTAFCRPRGGRPAMGRRTGAHAGSPSSWACRT
jgi:hypothetical protein